MDGTKLEAMVTEVLVFGITYEFGGTESYLWNLIKSIDRERYHFDFMTVGGKKAIMEDEFNQMFDDGRNHFYYPPDMKKDFFASKKWLRNFYDTHHYDIIYMNVTSAARIIYCDYAINRQKVKLVTHNHCADAVSKKAGINNHLFKGYTTRKSSLRLACSNEAFLYGFTCRLSGGQIIQNGIDVGRFRYNERFRREARSELNIGDEQIVIGHIGRFAKEKNQQFFLQLCEELGGRYVFLCTGAGEMKDELEAKMKNMGREKRFRILPFISETERLYSAMDIFAMPSFYEGLPVAAVEAQASGLPCLFSDRISAQTDICGHSVFLPLEKPALWIDAIKKLKQERFDEEQKLLERGFDMKDTAEKMTALFEEVISNG